MSFSYFPVCRSLFSYFKYSLTFRVNNSPLPCMVNRNQFLCHLFVAYAQSGAKVLLFFDICKYKMHATPFFCHFGIFYPFSPSFSTPSSAVLLFLCIPKNAILFAYSKNLLYLCSRKLTLGCLRDISE